LSPYPVQFSDNFVKGFIPGDPFKFSFAPFPDSLHGIFQAVGVIDSLPIGAPSKTGLYLGFIPIVCLNPLDNPVSHMDPEGTSSTAMTAAGGSDDLIIGSRHKYLLFKVPVYSY
jgi:hypothetical protein